MKSSVFVLSAALAFMTMQTRTLADEQAHNPSVAAQGSSQALGRLAGASDLIVGLDNPYGYSVVRGDQTKIESSMPDTISFRTMVSAPSGPLGQSSQYTLSCTVRYDSGSQTYILTLQKDGVAYVENLPMKYSDPTGFAGALTRSVKGKDVTSEGKIAFKAEGGHEWEICRSTPCQAGLSKPGHALTLTFYKPKPKQ